MEEPICDKCERQYSCNNHFIRINGTINIHYPSETKCRFSDGIPNCFWKKDWSILDNIETKFSQYFGIDSYDYFMLVNAGKKPRI